MLQAQKFPTLAEKEKVIALKKYSQLYRGNHYETLKLHNMIKKQFKNEKDIVYLTHNFPAYISDFYGDFVAGDTDKMIIRGDSGNTQVDDFVDEVVYENDLKEKLADIGTEQSEFGFVPLLGWVDKDQVFRISMVAQDQYFPQSDGSVVFTSYKDIYDSFNQKSTYCLTQHYRLEGNDCVIERQAWECDQTGTLAKPYDYENMLILLGRIGLPPTERLIGLGDLPIRVVENTSAKSDYYDIMAQLSEINERRTHIATQLLKNLDSKLILPASMIEDGKVKPYEAYAMGSKEDVKPEYLANANALLAEADVHINSQIKVISTISSVPMWELTKDAMPDTATSLRIQLFATTRKTARKRAKLKRALNDMFRIGFQMCSIDYADDIEIKFSDVLPVDELTQANTESAKITSGISSRRSAIMRIENIDEEEAQAELDQIKQEDQIAGIGDNIPNLNDQKVV